MNHPARWWLLSDLHLGMSDDDPRHPGSTLPEYVNGRLGGPAGS